MDISFCFPKSEKITAQKILDRLFADRTLPAVSQFPLKLVWMEISDTEANSTTQVVFLVPKRKIKKAHERNRIRRQLRELYRLNRHVFPVDPDKKTALLWIYLGEENPDFHEMEKCFHAIIEKWKSSLHG